MPLARRVPRSGERPSSSQRFLNSKTRLRPRVFEWLEERVRMEDGVDTDTDEVVDAFQDWIEAQGYARYVDFRAFGLMLEGRGFTRRKKNTGWVWTNLALVPETPGGQDGSSEPPEAEAPATTTQDPEPGEFGSRKATGEAPQPSEAGFDPLHTCPEPLRRRFRRRADLADRHPLKAIELACIECCGWQRPEAARCEIRTCPLWSFNWRIFGGRGV